MTNFINIDDVLFDEPINKENNFNFSNYKRNNLHRRNLSKTTDLLDKIDKF